jgi:hypothetical protein
MWIEAVGFELQGRDQPELKWTTDTMIREVVAVQEPSGYLNTYFTVTESHCGWREMLQLLVFWKIGSTDRNDVADSCLKLRAPKQQIFSPDQWRICGSHSRSHDHGRCNVYVRLRDLNRLDITLPHDEWKRHLIGSFTYGLWHVRCHRPLISASKLFQYLGQRLAMFVSEILIAKKDQASQYSIIAF